MSELSPRPVKKIDADLRSCCARQRDAEMELVEVRRRQAELVELEATLLAGIDMRRWRADRLLDERLLATTVAGTRGLVERQRQHHLQLTGLDRAEAAAPAHS